MFQLQTHVQKQKGEVLKDGPGNTNYYECEKIATYKSW